MCEHDDDYICEVCQPWFFKALDACARESYDKVLAKTREIADELERQRNTGP
jgi:hypothetical protein